MKGGNCTSPGESQGGYNEGGVWAHGEEQIHVRLCKGSTDKRWS